jgi:tetratricopeptide (TPR) repeat protein
MLDVELWGMDAGKHHLTNLFFHIINTLLLFFVLRGMTGALWKSAFAASLFALHPLNVDTVAWIAERKNLLSTFFWFLVMLSYLFYTKRPGFIRYMLVVLGFIMGLLAKPMLVTLPFVLLLMDYWPLGRIKLSRVDSGWSLKSDNSVVSNPWGLLKSRVIIDKIPLILLSLVSIYISMISLQLTGNISSEKIQMGLRVANAFVSYIAYLGKAIWPHSLAIYYPFPKIIPFWQVAGCFLLIVFISVLVVVSPKELRTAYKKRDSHVGNLRVPPRNGGKTPPRITGISSMDNSELEPLSVARKYPYLLVGWLWYIGTLFPVIGLVQGGLWPAMADRWAYVPLIGVYIMIAWGVPELLDKWRSKEIVLAASAGIVLSVLSVTSWIQAGYWMNSITLFEHALKVTDKNDIAHLSLGVALMNIGDLDGSINHYTDALRINPYNVDAYNDMGLALKKKGDTSAAISYFSKAILLDANRVDAYNNLGVAFLEQGNITEAITQLSKGIQIDPGYGEAYSNLGLARATQGNNEEAIKCFLKAVQLSPYSAKAHTNMALSLMKNHNFDGAIQYYRRALEIDPGLGEAHNGLGVALLRKGDREGAIREFQEVLRIEPGNVGAQRNLEKLLASRGEAGESLAGIKKALESDPRNAGLYVKLGDVYRNGGDLGRAMESYEKALSIEPGNMGALSNLAVVHAGRGEYDKALDVLKKVIEIKPESAGAYYNIACIYARQGKVDESVKWLKEAVDKGFADWGLLKKDRDLENIRGTAYYEDLMKRHGSG